MSIQAEKLLIIEQDERKKLEKKVTEQERKITQQEQKITQQEQEITELTNRVASL